MVIAHHQHLYAKRIAQNLLHEVGSRECRHFPRKGKHHTCVDARLSYLSQLLVERQQLRRSLVPQHYRRMLGESDYHRLQPLALRKLANKVYQVAMSPMNTIENTYRSHIVLPG